MRTILIALLLAAAPPLTRDDVVAFGGQVNAVRQSFTQVVNVGIAVSKGCPIIKAHPQGRQAFDTFVGVDESNANTHHKDFKALVAMSAALKSKIASFDPERRQALAKAIDDMTDGLRKYADAALTLDIAYTAAATLDCSSYENAYRLAKRERDGATTTFERGFEQVLLLAQQNR